MVVVESGVLSRVMSRTGLRVDLRVMVIDLEEPGAEAVLMRLGRRGWVSFSLGRTNCYR